MKTIMKSYLTVLFTILLMTSTAYAASEEDNSSKELSFFGEDGSLDLGEYMSQVYGFLPVPILITEPALGYGGGVALMYVHDKIGQKSSTGRNLPPSVSGIIIAATQNKTVISGLFHKGYWLEDTLRTMTYVGIPNIYMELYSPRTTMELHMEGKMLYQDIKKRVFETDLFVGLSYMYVDSDVSLDFEKVERDYKAQESIAALGLIAEYDNRDNQMSPNKGMLISAKTRLYDEAVGSDYKLSNYKLTTLFYNELTSKIHLNFNFVAEYINGDDETPLYLYPFISMRGIPMMKYQGGGVGTAQTELSYEFLPRWRALVFGGIGRTYSKQVLAPNRSFSEAPNIGAGGIGFRYLIASKLGLRMGVDIAKSEEDTAFYVQFGTAWHGF